MKKFYAFIAFLATISTASAQVIINEVLYDPSNNALDGDANGDGTYDQEGDAFIEFVNTGTTYANLSGYEIWDDTSTGQMRYEIPQGTILAPGGALVVFGGDTPSGDFGGAIVLVADTGSTGLSLHNSGEIIMIKDASKNVILSFDSDALSNNPNESYTRNPDITGNFEQHGDNTTRLFSPGRTVDSMPFAVEIHLQGVLDFTTPAAGASGKAIHLKADSAISDLSVYALGVANNGGGTDGIEVNLPSISVNRGDDILVVRDSMAMAAYLVQCFAEFEHVIVDVNGNVSQNGDDAIELFLGNHVIDVYGDPDVDGTGTSWEYTDAWAYKADTGWMTAMVDCTDGTENIYYSDCRYPICQNVLVDTIKVQGAGGATTIDTYNGTLQMEFSATPDYADDTTVTWSTDDTNIATIDANGLLIAVDNGTVTVTATANDGGGVKGTVSIVISNQVLSVQDIHSTIRMYPNPAGEKVAFEALVPIDQVKLFNLSGQEVMTVVRGFDQIRIDDLNNGMYYVEVLAGSTIHHYTLVKE